MSRSARSARGEVVDFDVLAIKQALASAPISVETKERRAFIDTKNGIKVKATPNALQTTPNNTQSEALQSILQTIPTDTIEEEPSSIVEDTQ